MGKGLQSMFDVRGIDVFWLIVCDCFGRFTEVHGFEKPHDERGLGLMNAAAVVRGIFSVYYLYQHTRYICICP